MHLPFRTGLFFCLVGASTAALAGCGKSGDADAAATAAPPPGVSSNPATETPGTSAGPLSRRALPTPAQLGRGWKTRVEGEDPDSGVGNGTAYQQRNPSEIAETAVPLGCEDRGDLPEPAYVLQATYGRGRGTYAVALRMRFASASTAAAFKTGREAALRACQAQPADPYNDLPAPVTKVAVTAAGTISEYETAADERRWLSLLSLRGSDVLTVDANPAKHAQLDWAALESFLASSSASPNS